MKPVKKLVFAALLVISLALHTFAGDIQQPGIAAPTPSPTPERMTTATNETIVDSTDSQPTNTSDYLFLEALAVLLSVY